MKIQNNRKEVKKIMSNILNTIDERDLKEAIIDIVNDNEYLQQENRKLENEIKI